MRKVNMRGVMFLFFIYVMQYGFSQENLKIDSNSGAKKQISELHYEKAKKQTEKLSDSSLYFINISMEYSGLNNFSKLNLMTRKLLIEYYEASDNRRLILKTALDAIGFAKSTENEYYLAFFYNKLARLYFFDVEYSKLYECSVLANEYSIRYNDTVNIARSYDNLSRYHYVLGEYDEAINVIDSAVSISVEPKKRAIYLMNRSIYYFKNKSFHDALESLYEAKKIVPSTDSKTLSRLDINIGISLFNLDSLDLSLHHFNQAYLYYEDHSLPLQLVSYHSYLGRIFLKKKKYSLSQHHLNKALSIVKKTELMDSKVVIYLAKYKLSLKLNQRDSALVFVKKYMLFNDSMNIKIDKENLIRNEWIKRLGLIEKKNILVTHQAEILNQELIIEENLKSWSIKAVLFSVLIIFLLVFLLFQRKKSSLIMTKLAKFEHEQSIELKNREMLTLKIQRLDGGEKIKYLIDEIEKIKSTSYSGEADQDLISHKLDSLNRLVVFDRDKDWEDFKFYFEKLDKFFFLNLKEKYPKLSLNDEKVLAYIKIGMDAKQISRLMNVLPDTVVRQKNRLRKKMSLPKESDIREFLDF